MAQIVLKQLSKSYGNDFAVLDRINLEIEAGSFVAFAGASGAGKSTVLRLIAGLEKPSSGEIFINGKNAEDLSIKDRDIAMMFQSDTLRKNKTVFDNIAIGLVLRGEDEKVIKSKVTAAAVETGIQDLLDLKVSKLNILQKKLTDLARIFARKPQIVLIDEPLCGLDEKQRGIVKTIILKLYKATKATFVYAAQDSTEALSLAEKIALLNKGKLVAFDTPQIIYDNPVNLFAAAYLGQPQMNFFDATISKEGDETFVQFSAFKIKIPKARARRIVNQDYFGKKVVLGVRPEDIHDEQVFLTNSPDTLIEAKTEFIERLGSETILHLKVDGKTDFVTAKVDARSNFAAGESITLALDAKRIQLFDKSSGYSIMGVPQKNLLNAMLVCEGETLSIKTPYAKVELPKGSFARLTEPFDKQKNIILEFSPTSLMDKESYDLAPFGAESKKRFLEIEATVGFVENYPDYTAVFASAKGMTGYVVSKLSPDFAIEGGEKIKLYCRLADIEVKNPDLEERVFAFRNISDNAVKAIVAVEGARARINFGKTSLILPSSSFDDSGEYLIKFDPNGFSLVTKKDPACIVCEVSDADFLGQKTVIYAKAEGFKDYLTAILNGKYDLEIGDKIILSVNFQKMYTQKF